MNDEVEAYLATYEGWNSCEDSFCSLIIEGMDAGILGQDEFRALAVAAELRQMRMSTLILLILRAFRD